VLTAFPILVNLTYDSDMQADYSDLRFYNTSCGVDASSKLAYEIENYTASNALIWVGVPSIAVGNVTKISVYYKNNTAHNGEQNATGVWDGNYLMVQHLEEINTGTRIDSTKYGANGTPTNYDNNEKATGIVDGADDLDGASTGDYIQTTANVTSANNITFEVWFNSDNTSSYRHIMWQGASGGNGWGAEGEMHISLGYNNGTAYYNVLSFYLGTQIPSSTVTSVIDIRTPFTDTTNFHYASFEVGGLATSPMGNAYLDGLSLGSDAGTTTNVSRSDWNTLLRIGHPGTGTGRDFDGIIDEVRVSNISRSANWINMTYSMMATNNGRLAFGGEENKPEGGVVYPFSIVRNTTGYGLFEWKTVEAGDIVMSGTPTNWTWQVFSSGSGRYVPNGTLATFVTNWTWILE
jgi:hypothetical protein